MQFYFDESGDFALPADTFDCYTQAAALCPDSFADQLEAFIAGRLERWELDELHATSLTPGQRLSVCRFIASSPIQLVAQATDTDLIDRATLSRWRLAQAAQLKANLDWYRSAGGRAMDAEHWINTRIKRVGLASQISDVEFLHAILYVDLVHASLQKALLVFTRNEWKADLTAFRFMLDARLPGKLAAGEKLLRDGLVPMLGSNARFRLDLVDAWKDADPPHPFIERFERSGGWSGAQRRRVSEKVIDLSLIFEHGLQFEQSHEHPGLQVADLTAYVIRNAVLRPTDWQAQLAYDLLRPKLLRLDGPLLPLVRLSTSNSIANAERYRSLQGID